jgi:hypothetical protein
MLYFCCSYNNDFKGTEKKLALVREELSKVTVVKEEKKSKGDDCPEKGDSSVKSVKKKKGKAPKESS